MKKSNRKAKAVSHFMVPCTMNGSIVHGIADHLFHWPDNHCHLLVDKNLQTHSRDSIRKIIKHFPAIKSRVLPRHGSKTLRLRKAHLAENLLVVHKSNTPLNYGSGPPPVFCPADKEV